MLDPTLDHVTFDYLPDLTYSFLVALSPRPIHRKTNELVVSFLPDSSLFFIPFLLSSSFFQDIVQLQRDLHNCERLFVLVSWPLRTRSGTSVRFSDPDSYANGGLHCRATARNWRLPLTGPHIRPLIPFSLSPSLRHPFYCLFVSVSLLWIFLYVRLPTIFPFLMNFFFRKEEASIIMIKSLFAKSFLFDPLYCRFHSNRSFLDIESSCIQDIIRVTAKLPDNPLLDVKPTFFSNDLRI